MILGGKPRKKQICCPNPNIQFWGMCAENTWQARCSNCGWTSRPVVYKPQALSAKIERESIHDAYMLIRQVADQIGIGTRQGSKLRGALSLLLPVLHEAQRRAEED